MKEIKPPKDKSGKIIISGEMPPIPKGHTPHKSGAGSHDSTPKRKRTRKSLQESIIREQEEL